MFTYKDLPDGRVALEMDMEDWRELLFLMGFATDSAKTIGDKRLIVDLINRINRTNPRFQQYELPPESVPEAKH